MSWSVSWSVLLSLTLLQVSTYMLELYNDRLQDLLVTPTTAAGSSAAESQQFQAAAHRVEIKRNRKGVVFAQGAEKKDVSNARELYALFKQACANRHISATSEFSLWNSTVLFVLCRVRGSKIVSKSSPKTYWGLTWLA